ncbi:MAG: hypothetical protein ACTIJ9_13450 [Aequorivita sp.]|uniref:hypothetical protein n=1 Tax=Aequorivita capsosiphonis TaxID=487317 RepID=UPI0003FEDD3A|nr:hypothetical protein [Aequorivita capsosiphonis]
MKKLFEFLKHKKHSNSKFVEKGSTYDTLFDCHLITFKNTGKIILSSAIKNKTIKKLGEYGTEKISKLRVHNLGYLDRHREHFGSV